MRRVYWLSVFRTLIVASIGGAIGYWTKLPAGTLMGSMMAVAISQLGGVNLGALPPYARPIAQVVVGAILGMGLKNTNLSQLKSLAIPAAIITGILILAGLGSGFILSRMLHINPATAFFSSMPGGMTEMALASADTDADPPVVALLHLIRLICVISLGVPLARLISK